MKASSYQKLLWPSVAVLLAVWVVGSTFSCIHLSYTAVPTWDMWNGYVDFAIRAAKGEWYAWLYNHNEHRLVLPRLFFYADFWWFNGKGVFLLIAIQALVLLNTCLLLICCENSFPVFKHKRLILFCLIAVGTFSWVQCQNFFWAFQIQFVLLYTVAMAAFLLFSRALRENGAGFSLNGTGAVLAALGAAGCMANGLLVLPLLSVWAWLFPAKRKFSVFLAALSVVLWVSYFYLGYEPPSDTPLLAGVLHAPQDAVIYLLRYLGSPMGFVSQEAATLLGGIGLLGIAWVGVQALRSKDEIRLQATFWIALFILVSAIVTTIGRVRMGADQAVASRYATSAIIFWVCLVALLMRSCTVTWSRWLVTGFAALLVGTLAWLQLNAKDVPYEYLFAHRHAALSLALQANDTHAEEDLMFSVSFLHVVSEEARTRRLTVFGEPWLALPVQMLGKPMTGNWIKEGSCLGAFETLELEDGIILHARGWQATQRGPESELILLVDSVDTVVGAAVSGEPREDLRETLRGRASAPDNPGWQGYVVRPAQGQVRAMLKERDGRYCQIGKALIPPHRFQ